MESKSHLIHGHRVDYDAARDWVFILTRSAFAGVQRYASATWSGDIASDWDVLRKQIPAGLNFALSGLQTNFPVFSCNARAELV